MLFDKINDMIEKENIGSECLYIPTYSTGIDILDYYNGRIEKSTPTVGVDGGKTITVIGKSGTGKSTLAMQIAINIVKDFEEGNIFHLDYERSTNLARIKMLSGWDDETISRKYKILNRDIYSESLYKIVKGIDNKKNEPEIYDAIKINSGEVDKNGNPIYVLPPTVVLVDSYALMMPADISEEEKLSGSMSATTIAKVNNSVIKRITGPLERGNIILIIINHITKKIEINAFAKTQADINYLKQDESIPGGTSLLYLSNNIIRCTASTKLDKDSTYGIKGFIVKGEYVKSRSNEAGNTFEMVFSQSEGFDNVLSNLHNLKDLNLLKGSPRAYYLENCPDIKFTLKTFKDKYNEHEELRNEVERLIKENYIKFIPNSSKLLSNSNETEEVITETKKSNKSSKKEKEFELKLVECVDEDEDIWLGNDGKYYDSNMNELDVEEEE